MKNIQLSVLGSTQFLNILNELEFNNILNSNSNLNPEKKISIRIIFVENLTIKDVKNYLLENEPIILFLKHKDYIKKNNLKLLDFSFVLSKIFGLIATDILSFDSLLCGCFLIPDNEFDIFFMCLGDNDFPNFFKDILCFVSTENTLFFCAHDLQILFNLCAKLQLFNSV